MKQERLNFDPNREVGYLKQFLGEARKQQLEGEIGSSLAELLLSEFSHDYLWNGEAIVDEATTITAKKLAGSCEFERDRVERVEEGLREGKDLIVMVSPRNEELDYPDDMVDFWKRGEGNRLTLMRFKVDMSQNSIKDFEMMNKEGYRLADLIQMLNLAKVNKGTSMTLIERTVSYMLGEFENSFGQKIYKDGEIMTRLYLAIRLEVEKRSGEIGIEARNYVILPKEIKKYLYGQFVTQKIEGGGCGGSSLGGQFASEGIIITKTAEGIKFQKGSTEGFLYCPTCGCWYDGDKCPICS